MNKDKPVIILGAGENGQVVKNIFRLNGNENIFFLDDNTKLPLVHGSLETFHKYSSDQYDFFVSFGENILRKKWFNMLMENKINPINAVHPQSFLEASVSLGKNVMIGANVYINIGTVIDNNVILNSGCLIEHDNIVTNHAQLGPGVITGGKVSIGKESFVGMGSIIIDHIRIGKKSIIGAGSVVISDTDDNGLYVGIPAKKKRNL